jgi:hypothetical protein
MRRLDALVSFQLDIMCIIGESPEVLVAASRVVVPVHLVDPAQRTCAHRISSYGATSLWPRQ